MSKVQCYIYHYNYNDRKIKQYYIQIEKVRPSVIKSYLYEKDSKKKYVLDGKKSKDIQKSRPPSFYEIVHEEIEKNVYFECTPKKESEELVENNSGNFFIRNSINACQCYDWPYCGIDCLYCEQAILPIFHRETDKLLHISDFQ